MMGDGGNLEKRTQVPVEELEPSALKLRLEALLRDAYTALPTLSEFHRTELVQSIVFPALSLQGVLGEQVGPQQGRTFQTIFLEERFDRKYRPKDEKRKKG